MQVVVAQLAENSFDPISVRFESVGSNRQNWAVVVTQFVEVRGSNPVIGKHLNIEHLFTVNCIERRKEKKKWQGMAHFIVIVKNLFMMCLYYGKYDKKQMG